MTILTYGILNSRTRNRFTDAPNPYDSAEKERFMRCLLGAGITECEKPLEKATDLSNLPALAEQQFIVEVGPKYALSIYEPIF